MFGFRLPISVAAWIVVGLAAPYILLNTLFPGLALTYTLGMAIALLALVVLLLAGITPRQLGLRLSLWRESKMQPSAQQRAQRGGGFSCHSSGSLSG